MILTNNKSIYQKAKYLTTQAKNDSLRSIHHEVGFNYRLTNIQACIGLAQLESINKFLTKKAFIHRYYAKLFSEIEGLNIVKTPKYAKNNYWLNILNIDNRIIKKSALRIINELEQHTIQTRPIWYLNHLQKPFKKFQSMSMHNATKLLSSCICLPSSSDLKIDDMNYIQNSIKKILFK